VSIEAADVRVGTGACIYVPCTVTYQNVPGHEHSWSADIEVWRGPRYLDSTFAWEENAPTSDAVTIDLKDERLWCSSDGFGTIRPGRSQVDVSDYDTAGMSVVRQDARVSLDARRRTPRRMVNLTAVPNGVCPYVRPRAGTRVYRICRCADGYQVTERGTRR
jgi:hypothetical protein